MGDEMDPCECMWTQEMAMRRLLSILRQGQAYCTDTECIDELPGISPGGATSNFLLMALLFSAMLVMYVMRPNQNGATEMPEATKTTPFKKDNDDPPTPPPATN